MYALTHIHPPMRAYTCIHTCAHNAMQTGSKWSRVSMLMPELSPIWAHLSRLLPDQPLLDQWKVSIT